jgi:two-component system chemotaxis response regulator CheB
MNQIVRVLIVDDSAYVRKVLREMLSRSPFLEVVGAARDGEEALELVESLRPDVVTLDLNMPRSDGLDFLRRQMLRRPLPVLVVSVASESGELVMQALDEGAVDVVQKPTALATDRMFDIAADLVAKVKAAAGARVRLPAATPAEPNPSASAPRAGRTDVLVIGVSTGGPQALKRIIPLGCSQNPWGCHTDSQYVSHWTELRTQTKLAIGRTFEWFHLAPRFFKRRPRPC